MRPQTLAKAERLKSRKSIQTLFREGKAFSVFPYKVYYAVHYAQTEEASDQDGLKTGFGVSSRFFRKAVDRNRIRRVGREAWRRQKHRLEDAPRSASLHVFLVYTGRELPEYAVVFDKIAVILDRLKKECGRQQTKDTTASPESEHEPDH